MSDFLARLASRVLGGEATVTPRLPSWFEPPAQVAPEAPADGPAAALHLRVGPRTPSLPAATIRPGPAPASAAALAGAHAAPPVVPVTEPVPAVPAPVAAAAAAPARNPRPTPTTTARARQDAPASRRGRAPDPTAAAARKPPPTPASPAQPRGRVSQSARGVLQRVPTPVFPTSTRTQLPDALGATARRRTIDSAAAHTPPSMEPTVQVTIGRLEVRAAPVPAAPRRQRDAPSPTSLDDYLRQRDRRPSP